MNIVLVFWVYIATIPTLGLALAVLSLKNYFSLAASPILFPLCSAEHWQPRGNALIPHLLNVEESKRGRFTYLGIVSILWPLKVLWVIIAWVCIVEITVPGWIKVAIQKFDDWVTG